MYDDNSSSNMKPISLVYRIVFVHINRDQSEQEVANPE